MLNELDDTSKDTKDAPIKEWWWDDLGAIRGRRRPEEPLFVQPCLKAVTMGDINVVSVVEHVNRALLLKAGCSTDRIVFPGGPFPGGGQVADIYVDDAVILMLGKVARLGR